MSLKVVGVVGNPLRAEQRTHLIFIRVAFANLNCMTFAIFPKKVFNFIFFRDFQSIFVRTFRDQLNPTDALVSRSSRCWKKDNKSQERKNEAIKENAQ